MTKAQIAAAIQAIVRLQLDDCKRAIKDGTKTIALNELGPVDIEDSPG